MMAALFASCLEQIQSIQGVVPRLGLEPIFPLNPEPIAEADLPHGCGPRADHRSCGRGPSGLFA